MAIKVSGTEVISDDKRILNNESLPDIRPSLLLDFANSKTLDPRITFTRGSTATYWDGKTTAKAEENLVKYSQDFSTIWSFGPSGAAGTITNNNATAPDGTTTAALIQATATTSQHYLQRPLSYYSPVSGQTYTLSCYLKAGTVDDVQFVFGNGADFGAAAYINVDLTAGTITHTASSISASSITDVGNGWYRVTMSAPAIGSNNQGNFITSFVDPAAPTGRLQNFTTAGTETYYIWGCQVEQRSSATAYTPTTDSPIVKYQPVLQTAASGEARFDHDPVTGESKGLLIEEARTNLLTYSEAFDNAAWNKTQSTVASNSIIAPNGTQAANTVTPTAVSGLHNVSDTEAVTSGTTYTFSVYAKANGYSRVTLDFQDGFFGASAVAEFNLQNGTIATASDGTDSITDVGNGWYRITSSCVATSSGDARFYYQVHDGTVSFTGNGYSGVFLWGEQVEAGSFPTSYIPTSGSTVTRAKEEAIFAYSDSGWNQKETTIYTDIVIDHPVANSYPRVLELGGAGYLALSQAGAQAYLQAVKSDFPTINSDPNSITGNASYKIAASFSAGEGFAIGVDGDVNVASGSTFYFEDTPPSFQILASGASDRFVSGYIKKLAFYPKRLPNATLQAMTEA